MEPLKGGKVALEVLVRGKDAEQNEALFRKITDKITGAGVSHIIWELLFRADAVDIQKKLGILPKDTSTGPFIDEWKRIYGEISNKIEEVDIAPALSAAALAVKDENELVRSILLTFLAALIIASVLCEMLRKPVSPS